LKFGAKEYFFFVASIVSCTGKACNVHFNFLYDPAIKRAILLPQFGSDFICGYDQATRSPVFIDMSDSWEENYIAKGLSVSGKIYRLNYDGKVKQVRNKEGKQFYFEGYSAYDDDTLSIYKSNIITQH
jgi:hypothetical protein